MGAKQELWNAYRVTWEAFSRKLDELQSFVEAGDRVRAEEALLAVEQARVAHNAARDRVAALLSKEITAMDAAALSAEKQRRVRQTAHLLWEIAGKPAGTAESDWHKAERLVMTASASS
jgi:hypothetical protein